MERALHDEDISAIGISVRGNLDEVEGLRKAFVGTMINQLDLMFGRTLGCRANATLKAFVQADNHLTTPPVCLNKSKKKKFFAKMSRQNATNASGICQ